MESLTKRFERQVAVFLRRGEPERLRLPRTGSSDSANAVEPAYPANAVKSASDESDLEALANPQTLTDILFHEIGHVLGFGTLWDGSGCVPGAPRCLNYVEGEGGEDPTFTGPEAVREWQALGGTGAVPIENRGGSGTRLSHWRESVFDSEIMTGFIERTGAPNPLSRATIASLADLGYPVSHVVADPYALPAAAALAAPALTSPCWELPLPDPPVPLTPR